MKLKLKSKSKIGEVEVEKSDGKSENETKQVPKFTVNSQGCVIRPKQVASGFELTEVGRVNNQKKSRNYRF